MLECKGLGSELLFAAAPNTRKLLHAVMTILSSLSTSLPLTASVTMRINAKRDIANTINITFIFHTDSKRPVSAARRTRRPSKILVPSE